MRTQDTVLKFIKDYKAIHQGNTPTLREISDGCQLSSQGHALYHVEHLEKASRITRTGASGRNIEIPGAVWELRGERE